MLLALITNSLIYKQKSKHDVHPCPAEKKRTNRIGNTETETQQLWFSVPTQNRNPVSVIHYYYQVFNSTCCQRKKKTIHKNSSINILLLLWEKRNQKTKMLWQFFSPKNQKSNQKQDKKDPRDFWSRETFNLMRLLISQSKL